MNVGAISNSFPMYYGNYSNNQVSSEQAASAVSLPGQIDENKAVSSVEDPKAKPGYESSPEKCQTCRERKYQDGSDEMNVSFKSAAHISPQSAASAVRAHEGEHVKNAYAKAKEGNGKVVSATVSIHTGVCPECGKTYVSGGTTNTAIKYKNESNPYQQNQKAADATSLSGANANFSV